MKFCRIASFDSESSEIMMDDNSITKRFLDFFKMFPIANKKQKYEINFKRHMDEYKKYSKMNNEKYKQYRN